MRKLDDMAPDEVLRVYFAERRRRENPPSLAGIDPEAPKERKPGSGLWEELIALTRGCDPAVLAMMYEASGMYQLGGKCHVSSCYQTVDHEHRDMLGTDGHPLMSGGQSMTIAVCKAVPPSVIAKKHGLDPKKVKRMTGTVLEQVAENMGAKRQGRRTHEGPTLEDVQRLAKEVLG